MADNVTLNSGTGGAVAAADDIAGVHHQRVKIEVGADGTAQDCLPIANAMDSTGTGIQAVGIVGQLDDAAVGTVTENQFAPVRISSARRLLVDGSGTTQPVTSNGANLATEASLSALAGDVGDTADAAATAGSTGTLHAKQRLMTTQLGAIQTAVEGTLVVDGSGVTQPVSGTVTIQDGGNTITVDGTVAVTNAGLTELAAAINASSQVDVNIAASGATVPVSGTFWQATQPVSGTVTANLAAGTNTNEVVGDVAHDAGVAGNPILIAGAAQDTDDTAPPNRVNAEADATRLATDRDGSLYVRTHGPQVWSYHSNGSSALTDASVHATPGAGLSLYVTDIIFSNGSTSAMNIFFEEGASTVLGPWYLEAVSGRSIHIKFTTPKKITANTALTVTTSAAAAHSVDVTGFTAQG
jgi:hypothetical protein